MSARVETLNPVREHRLVLIALATMVLVVAVYWQTFSRMVGMWTLADYQYGWLVYPLSLYVLWRKRHALAQAPVRPTWLGVAGTGMLVLGWTLARAVGVQVVEFIAASLLIPAVFWAVAGTPAARVAAFPLGLLLAGVPTGEFLVGHLQESTALISTALLHIAGVPTLREGMFLTLPGGTFEVAETCGGLRYLLAAIMASLAYAYLSYAVLWKRVLFVAIVAVTMIVANGLRAFIVMYVASATDMQVFGGRDHVYFGMFLFATVFAGLIYVGDRYAERRARAEPHPRPFPQEDRGSAPITVAVLLCVGLGPGLLLAQVARPAPAIVTAALPALAGCRGPAAWSYDWSPRFAGADRTERAAYRCGQHDAGIYFAGYSTQAQGKELIHSGNRIWPHAWRRYVQQAVVPIDTDDGRLEVRQVYVRAPDRSMLIWYWYQVGEQALSNGVAVKLATAAATLGLRPAAASVLAVQVEVPREADAEALRPLVEPKARTMLAWYRAHAGDLR